MLVIRTLCIAAVLSLGANFTLAASDEPGLEDDEIQEHVVDPITPGLDAFKAGVVWSLFGAAFVGAWGSLVAGVAVALATFVGGIVGGVAYGFVGGLFTGVATQNVTLIFVGPLLGAVLGLVAGLIWGIVAGLIGGVVASVVGGIVAALAGSLGFGIIGVLIHVSQQWLARVPFALARERAKPARRTRDDPPDQAPPPAARRPAPEVRPLLPGG
ncbi:MAG: hypothetical protein HY904_10550 [Deltaproteobacteria bacterium]|nr:hypothetical protein [Deltaproteobacteria bacterium]